jgi:defect-in-organelle-trafficking protein DotC
MLQNGYIVPPAITRIRNVRQLSGPNYLYLTNGSYEIVRDARLTTIAPSWMDYLILPIRDVRPPDGITMQTDEERAIWRRTVEDGWTEGVREARLSFSTALATLHRDFAGMILYHDLARQGAVSVPRVDVSNRAWRVTEDGRRAFEGETTIKIVVASGFRRRN